MFITFNHFTRQLETLGRKASHQWQFGVCNDLRESLQFNTWPTGQCIVAPPAGLTHKWRLGFRSVHTVDDTAVVCSVRYFGLEGLSLIPSKYHWDSEQKWTHTFPGSETDLAKTKIRPKHRTYKPTTMWNTCYIYNDDTMQTLRTF